MKTIQLPLLLSLLSASLACAADLSEQDYFAELPEVLTVTRLAQPLSETPGAVTIIDRTTIRRSGARELADVLRLVPGYLVAGYNGANPNAAYHVPIDDYGIRNLVMVDGRAVYSSLYLGGTHRGMMGVLLDDIERIEVLRGSNSAAFGANAMFGVINIVTRHAADTQGGEISVSGGEGGLSDAYARIGWGSDAARFRLSAGRRSDSGYRNAFDDKKIDQLHLRGDLRPAANHDLMLMAGATELHAGDGFTSQAGNPERTVRWQNYYVHGQWRIQMSDNNEVKLSANYDQEALYDKAPYSVVPGMMLDYGGRAQRLDIELQHQANLTPELRLVWGAGYKHEEADSKPLYDARSPVSSSERRFFGNAAWQPNRYWTLNTGGYWGDSSETGSYFAPRLMANLHLTPDHTLRAGATDSMRAPTLFELKGDVRYYINNTLIGRTTTARGNVSQEKLSTIELGYFGNWRDLNLTLDVRAFHERMKDTIKVDSYRLTAAEAAGLITGSRIKDYINDDGLKVRGAEYQLRWKPLSKTEIWLNQTFMRQVWDNGSTSLLAPTRVTSLALFQRLPFDLELSLIHHTEGEMTWRGESRRFSQRRTDIRLAMPFRIGSTRAEAAVTVQSANGNYLAFFPYDDKRLIQERRAFGTLRLEF